MAHTIALVDDDRNILTGISMALEREGFKVQTYIDGESALIGLTRNPPDLAVLDIKMPRMDGEELLKKLKKKMSIPIIFLTSKDVLPFKLIFPLSKFRNVSEKNTLTFSFQIILDFEKL